MNNDNVINMLGIMEIAKPFNCKAGDNVYYTYLDMNVDGAVNMTDILIVAKSFNKVGEN